MGVQQVLLGLNLLCDNFVYFMPFVILCILKSKILKLFGSFYVCITLLMRFTIILFIWLHCLPLLYRAVWLIYTYILYSVCIVLSSDARSGSGRSAPNSASLKVNMVAWSSDDENVITAFSDFSVRIWSSTTGEPIRLLEVRLKKRSAIASTL